jgi:hypothetical protein
MNKIENRIFALDDMQAALNNAATAKEDQLSCFSRLDDKIKNSLYGCVWLAHRKPKEDPDFGRHAVEQNPDILLKTVTVRQVNSKRFKVTHLLQYALDYCRAKLRYAHYKAAILENSPEMALKSIKQLSDQANPDKKILDIAAGILYRDFKDKFQDDGWGAAERAIISNPSLLKERNGNGSIFAQAYKEFKKANHIIGFGRALNADSNQYMGEMWSIAAKKQTDRSLDNVSSVGYGLPNSTGVNCYLGSLVTALSFTEDLKKGLYSACNLSPGQSFADVVAVMDKTTDDGKKINLAAKIDHICDGIKSNVIQNTSKLTGNDTKATLEALRDLGWGQNAGHKGDVMGTMQSADELLTFIAQKFKWENSEEFGLNLLENKTTFLENDQTFQDTTANQQLGLTYLNIAFAKDGASLKEIIRYSFNEQDMTLEGNLLTKEKVITKTPSTLLVSLDRNGGESKLRTSIEIPEVLDLSDFISRSSNPAFKKYNLKAVVTHKGGHNGGHYYAYVKNNDNNNNNNGWLHINDAQPSKKITSIPNDDLKRDSTILVYTSTK